MSADTSGPQPQNWTAEERATLLGEMGSGKLYQMLEDERCRAISFAKSLANRYAIGSPEPGFVEFLGRDILESIREPFAFLHSLGLLEKHSEHDWYRLPQPQVAG